MNISSPIWDLLKKDLTEKVEQPVDIVFVKKITEQYLDWFNAIDKDSFDTNLRYTSEQVVKRFRKVNRLFFFVLIKQKPIALLLGYKIVSQQKKYFYLDEIAVLIERKGIGGSMIKHLILWAKEKGFQGIKLDTELINPYKGTHLVTFYEKLGFKKIKEYKNGDITLIYDF